MAWDSLQHADHDQNTVAARDLSRAFATMRVAHLRGPARVDLVGARVDLGTLPRTP